MSDKSGGNGDDAGRQIRFHYIKNNNFRVIHVDGAYGGLTPRGNIHMAVYSERNAIPRETTFALKDSGGLVDKPKEVVSRDGVVRELDADLMMDVKTAKEVHQWLGQQIAVIEKTKQAQGGQN